MAAQGLSTEIILPPYRQSLDLLDEGWEEATAVQAREQGLWIVGTAGSFRFFSAVGGPTLLEVEATALASPDMPQVMQLEVNGRTVHREAMPRQWKRYEFSLSAQDVRLGWNVVTMRFRHALRPRDLDSASGDVRLLAARSRRLRIRSSFGRTLWADGPSAIEVTPVAADRSDVSTILMPTDSALDVYLLPEHGAILTGSVDAVVADRSLGGGIWASLELVEASGRVHQLLEYDHGARGTEPFKIGLDSWAGHPVQLRLRSWGRTNGVVRWSGVTISTATDPTVARVTYPAHLVDPPRSGRLRRPDIIVILLDAARADVFSAGTLPTPGTDELAAEGTRFEHARAAAPWTGQSVPSLLTGRFPGSIGALTWGSPIPVEALTLSELLRESGYHTVVWSQHNLYGGNQTVRRGFERFTEVRSDVLADRNLLPEATDLFVDRRPTFPLIHLLPPHGPYEPPAPFAGAYTDWYTGDFPVDAPALNSAARADRRQPTDDDLRYVRSRYDENVVFADALVERLLRVLREAERYNDALVVLTSDHGEGFFEHGYFLHTRLLYDEFLRIPLIIKWPQTSVGFAPVVDANVNLVDVVPTLVDGLGSDTRPRGISGAHVATPGVR